MSFMSRITGRPDLAQVARLIRKGHSCQTDLAIKEIRDQLAARLGQDEFPKSALLTPEARAKVRRPGDELLFDRVKGIVGGDEARALTDHMLLLPGVGKVIFALNEAARRDLPKQFDYKEENTPDGLRVEFDPKGKSLGEIVLAINREANRLWHRDAIHPGVLYQNPGMKASPSRPIVLYPRLYGSNFKTRREQEVCLGERRLVRADRDALVVAVGLRRLQSFGFPFRDSDVGTLGDLGDLLEAQVVVAKGGSVRSYDYGVGYDNSCYDHIALPYVWAAASPSQ